MSLDRLRKNAAEGMDGVDAGMTSNEEEAVAEAEADERKMRV
jgi:hypothetical protein